MLLLWGMILLVWGRTLLSAEFGSVARVPSPALLHLLIDGAHWLSSGHLGAASPG